MEESTNAPAGAGSCPWGFGTLPVLVYDHGRGSNNRRQTAFAIGDESLHTSIVPELADNYYHATPHGLGSHGWVILVAPGPSPRPRLWDPRSGESVPLPIMELGLPEDWECCLSDAPTAPSCVVLVLDMKKPRFLYCRVGDTLLSTHDYDIGDVMLSPEYAPPSKLVIQQTGSSISSR